MLADQYELYNILMFNLKKKKGLVVLCYIYFYYYYYILEFLFLKL